MQCAPRRGSGSARRAAQCQSRGEAQRRCAGGGARFVPRTIPGYTQKIPWWLDPVPVHRMPAEARQQVWRKRTGGREFLPESWERNAGYSTGGRQRIAGEQDDDYTRLPFLRNGVPRPFDVAAVLGEPPNTADPRDTPPGCVPHQLNFGHLGTVRPYETPSPRADPDGGAVHNHQAFIGTFLNAFVALDAEEWDTEALLSDVESSDAERVLRHLTSLIAKRHMHPRRLSDVELAPLLARCTGRPMLERVWALALESHAPGMDCLRAAAALCGRTGDAELARRMLSDLDERGVPRSADGVAAVLAAHTGATDAGACLGLWGEAVGAPALPPPDGDAPPPRPLLPPTLLATNAVLRCCAAAGRAGDAHAARQGVLAVEQLRAAGGAPNRHTLHYLVTCAACSHADGSVEAAAAAAEMLLGLLPPLPAERSAAPWQLSAAEAAECGAACDQALSAIAAALPSAVAEVREELCQLLAAELDRMHDAASAVDALSPGVLPSPWHRPVGVAAVCRQLSPSMAAALDEMVQVERAAARGPQAAEPSYGVRQPAAAEAFLRACAVECRERRAAGEPAAARAAVSLAEGMWRATDALSARTTRRLYAAMLSVAEASANPEMAEAVYSELAEGPLGAQDVHAAALQAARDAAAALPQSSDSAEAPRPLE
eukprot:TRINITY_DN10217_c0_g1_i1.p1 TRINITY_DN10217_c0_g1~~TRINITY_DN10217_c0_g1_i1.p1  ORF type:complete len:659 (+),score=101.92 TRINITY_DN10217_c0_g1_i1:86-2062(+)